MRLSIIIPTFNEAECIGSLVEYLQAHSPSAEIIVTDGGSSDDTLALAKQRGATALPSPQKGRAAQMNYGASFAGGDVFYFVHADTLPPMTFNTDIEAAIEKGYSLGRYQTKFDSNKLLLRFNAFFTRFDLFECYGGDQSLFIQRQLFEKISGFDASLRIMEDYEIVTRARPFGKYKILDEKVLVSARKYDNNSWWKVQRANYTIMKMYKQGAPQKDMVERYRKMLDYR